MTTGEGLGTALAGLGRASRDRLAEHWAEYFGAPPPPRTSRSLMIRAVAYKTQERALGGLSVATRRLLSGQEPALGRRRRTLSPGTVLIQSGTASGIRSRSSKRVCSIAESAIARYPRLPV
jgi:hypothetical protein